jgi:hypothetical protein
MTRSGIAFVKRLSLGAAVLAVLAAPAFAQGKQQDDSPAAMQLKEKKKAAAQIDLEYRAALERTSQDPTPVKVDPWANMRGTETKTTDGKGSDSKIKRP